MARSGALRSASDPARAEPARAREAPRLVVLLVVDQMGTEVLGDAWPFLSDRGFVRLAREGAAYWRTRYDYATTETGPGHATIATGAAPSSHGIVANRWPSCDGRQDLLTYCTAGKPNERHESEPSPEHLTRPTLGMAMKQSLGSSARVVSVSLKDRAAILMAGRLPPTPGAVERDLVAWYDADAGRLTSSDAYATPSSPFLAALGEAGTSAGYGPFEWKLLDRAHARHPERDPHADLGADENPLEEELLGSRSFPRRWDPRSKGASRAFSASPAGNEMVLAVAKQAIQAFHLGEDDTPDLLCISFSSNDYVGHLCGPRSHEVRDMTLRTDLLLGQLLDHLDVERGLGGRYCLIATADHGAGPLLPPIARPDGTQRARKAAEAELIAHVERALDERFAGRKSGRWVRCSSAEILALDHAAIERTGVKVPHAADVAVEALATYPGVFRAYAVERLAASRSSSDPIEAAVRRSIQTPRSGDVFVVLEPYLGFDSEKRPTTHGAPWDYDQEVPLFLFGPGIKKGWSDPTAASPASGVVTIARLLGVDGLEADYPPLIDALE